ncbi:MULTISPECIES: toxin-antitoxin system YwqK family antitoxin [Tenacibaculum]|uniref:toxin-antitoxin system YwqK family antitoxin n=1 Tax=Tenacibaculum TaxID=104267 RepID=UPI00089841EA|nr:MULTISPECIES: hypothetical protein [unclassified Tenacibaculum]RBW60814.1 hypothetical protein DS884_04355 [Tenacibaculum sp. E3R01]SEE57485.1 MORN repeat variant [Tenacibaculum sp. MAR_2010_89]
MKKNFIIITLLLLCVNNLFSQKDSIVNYINHKEKITKRKKEAKFIETIVKKDTIWVGSLYFRNGKLAKRGAYKFKDKKNPQGKFVEFYRNGNLKKTFSFNKDGDLNGIVKSWFYNGGVDNTLFYINGVKTGIWKYYHTNGNIACRQYFSKGKLMKTLLYNENGVKVKKELIERKKLLFKGGDSKVFFKRIKKMYSTLITSGFQINGRVYLNFIVTSKGKMIVNTSDKIPIDLKNRLKIYFKNIKGWEPAIHMSRKVPVHFSTPFHFYTSFN